MYDMKDTTQMRFIKSPQLKMTLIWTKMVKLFNSITKLIKIKETISKDCDNMNKIWEIDSQMLTAKLR